MNSSPARISATEIWGQHYLSLRTYSGEELTRATEASAVISSISLHLWFQKEHTSNSLGGFTRVNFDPTRKYHTMIHRTFVACTHHDFYSAVILIRDVHSCIQTCIIF